MSKISTLTLRDARATVLLFALCTALLVSYAAAPASSATPEKSTSEQPAPAENASIPADAQRWSDPATWGGSLPDEGETITIPEGKTVLLDKSPPPLEGLQIDGTLIFDNDYINLSADWIIVHGKLQMGTAAAPITRRATITLTGSDPDENIMGMGTKLIGVMGGTFEAHGADRAGWTRLVRTATKGTREITLVTNPGWKVGDRIAISSTDFNPEQAEEATITAVTGNTLKLSRSLTYTHFGATQKIAGRVVNERAEVALLSRNVRIEGEENTSLDGFGGQVMTMDGGQVRFDGVELRRMGQKNTLRRYPIHFHMLGNAGANSYVRDSSIHHTYNRCMTIHGTNRLRVTGNVCYDNVGHAFFFEDGAETDNVLVKNLGFLTRRPAEGERLLASDRSPATFWVTNPDNVLRYNVAGGSEGIGFWYALPKNPTGLSKTDKIWPRRTPLGVFYGNVSHSNEDTGLNVDDGPQENASDTETTYYEPHSTPTPPASGQPDSDTVVADFQNFISYKNRFRGVWLRGENHRMTNAVLADNGIGATFASHESYLVDSLVVGETANLGTPEYWENKGENGRSLPMPWYASYPIRGYEYYDGKVGAIGTTFANFQPNSIREASGVGMLLEDAFGLHPQNLAENLTFVNAKKLFLPGPAEKMDGDRSLLIHDRDGSLSGTEGSVITSNSPFLAREDCTKNESWNAYVCPPGRKYGGLLIGTQYLQSAPIKPVRVTNEEGSVQTLHGCCSDSREAHTNLALGKTYRVDYNGGTPDRFNLVLRYADQQSIIVKVPYAKTPKVTKWGDCDIGPRGPSWCRGVQVTSPSQLEANSVDRSSYYYDANAKMLYIKLVSNNPFDSSEVVDWMDIRVQPAS